MAERVLGVFVFVLLLMLPLHPASGGVKASFRYPLSSFSGPVASQSARLAVDRERNEVYALNRRENDIRIFDEHGMQIHAFAEGFSAAADIAIGDDGDIFVLSRGYETSAVQLFDYRGEWVSEITPKNVPAAFSGHTLDRLVYRQGSLYLVDSESMAVIVLDADGDFQEGFDLDSILRRALADDDRLKKNTTNNDWEEDRLEDVSLNGFAVDEHGNMFFTIPVLFAAFRLSVDGKLAEFGRPGSGPGRFGVAAGIVSDDRGYIYVADRLRSVVLVFDRNFVFQTEFGYRGDRPSNLIVPDDLAVDARGNIYVAQAANRGVSVFGMIYGGGVPSRGAEAPSADSETYGRAAEEANPPERSKSTVEPGGDTLAVASESFGPSVEDVDPPERSEPIVDQGGDGLAAVSANHGPSAEGVDPTERSETIVDQGGDTASTGPEQRGPIVEEVYLPDRLEFIFDGGGDTPSADSGKFDPTTAGNSQFNQVESVEDEKD